MDPMIEFSCGTIPDHIVDIDSLCVHNYRNIGGRAIPIMYRDLYERIVQLHGHIVLDPQLTRYRSSTVVASSVLGLLTIINEMTTTMVNNVNRNMLEDWQLRLEISCIRGVSFEWVKERIYELRDIVENRDILQISQDLEPYLEQVRDNAYATLQLTNAQLVANNQRIEHLLAQQPDPNVNNISIFPDLFNALNPHQQ